MNEIEVATLIPDLFAPWVQALNLSVESLHENGAAFTLPASEQLIRGGGTGGGVICGQALAAAADTVSVLTLTHLNNRFRACTTTDMNIKFMRALTVAKNTVDTATPDNPILLHVKAVSNGKRMAVTQVEFKASAATKVAALSSCSFLYLED